MASSSTPFDAKINITGNNNNNGAQIKVKRSDGLTHDLVSVFKNTKNFLGLKKKDEVSQTKDNTDHNDHADHGMIKLHRSDGLNCDIINVFKGLSDTRGDSLTPIKPHVMNDYLIKRSSMSKIEVQNLLSKPKNTGTVNAPISNAPTSIRIVHMSNTHNHLNRSSSRNFLPEGDILIHSGSFTNHGSPEEYEQFDAWLASVKDIYHYRVVVAGFNDVKVVGNDWDFVKRHLPNATHVLCHSEATVLGIRIYGLPWHWAHEPNYSIKSGAPSSTCGRFDDIPQGIDVLVTHGPAYGKLDTMGNSNLSLSGKETHQSEQSHIGSRELEEAIKSVQPGVHLHGLCAEARGIVNSKDNSPLTLNSCMCDPSGKTMYTCPQVVKCKLKYIGASQETSGKYDWDFILGSLF